MPRLHGYRPQLELLESRVQLSVLLSNRGNVQVSFDTDPNAARSESALAANPLNPANLVGTSKRFTNPSTYDFTLAAYATFDGGQTWQEAPPLPLLTRGQDGYTGPTWAGISDPVVAWDNGGHVYLVALPFTAPGANAIFGMAVYESSDGGLHWSTPTILHRSSNDDKQNVTDDRSPTSPYFGNVYAAWDDGYNLAFARTTDHGQTWKGVGNRAVGTPLAYDSFGPALSVADDGTLYITWIAGSVIKFVKSTDGGNTFSAPAILASGVQTLDASLPGPGGYPEFPGANFRVLTLPTLTTGAGSNLVVTWADYRQGISQIYERRSSDGGATWEGPASGQPLLTGDVASPADQQDFHPQMARTPTGEIGVAFYEFGPKVGFGSQQLIDVVFAVSVDGGATFPSRLTVTAQPWDPSIDAPLSHGDPRTTFIGDYFGLAGSPFGFSPFWTDTRTGIQEIFTDTVSVNTLVVTSTADAGPGSLRQALLDANANPSIERIAFNLPGSGVHTISLLSPLPVLSSSVTIDGYTQPGASANTLTGGDNAVPLIELRGDGEDYPGLVLAPPNTRVRGLILNGFGDYGLILLGSAAAGDWVEGNFIGTDATGSNARGNGGGILILGGHDNSIGGSAPAARNLISGNASQGVAIAGAGTVNNWVQGNEIGTDSTGLVTLGNGGNGIAVTAGASNNSVVGNTIAFNGNDGVLVDSGTGNAISQNSSFANGNLGIELVNGGNNSQAFPSLYFASTDGMTTSVQGSLVSTPNSTFTLEFFANALPSPTGYGEGKQFLGSVIVSTDASGTASFTINFGLALGAGQFLAATATDAANDTSPFSANIPVQGSGPGGGASVAEGLGAVEETLELLVVLACACPGRGNG